MTPESVMTLIYATLKLTLSIAGPLLLVTLIVGLLISIFQAATQINEMTLSFIPKLLAMCAALVLLGPWILNTLVDFMRQLISNIPTLAM
ncbi:flagellar biosynthesis protein FliQ [Corticimicrobacter populi]|uniref:Flagellar biosynthetic protein FliQ n=1 Tax=Corticimicrobacter populi TaxID=2175229 RepID=A0A2V1JVM0_9BURK|nr:flagellar biosynthesis protein FliQ [Corticimicrobacter populi]PWF21180.1 flagellar biosynthetic protein FliQ [Corticimicrobacter populi]